MGIFIVIRVNIVLLNYGKYVGNGVIIDFCFECEDLNKVKYY